MKVENSKTCEGCDANCCRYVAIEIDCPDELKDFENIKWYVAHENIIVYVEEDGTWNVQFNTKCKWLNGDSLCKNYNRRPKICQEYNHDECTFHNPEEYKELYTFKCIEDVENYVEEVFKKGKHIVIENEEED